MLFQVASLVFLSISSVGSALRLRSSTTLQICPLLGQQFPAPTSLATEPAFQTATKSLESKLNAALGSLPYNETTFSIGMFSTSDEGLVYQYHHTDPTVTHSKLGTNKVDANSIYRVGSMTKLLTVYSFLINQGGRLWTSPITDFVPELLDVDNSTLESLGYSTPRWAEIELGDIASQMAGLARDYGLDDLAPANQTVLPLSPAVKAMLPHLPAAQVPICAYLNPLGELVPCTKEEYLHGMATEAAIFPSAYTPAYSNEGFALFGIAVSNIMRSSLESIFNSSFIEPLGLTSTTYSVPSSTTNHDVIPGGSVVESGWSTELGIFGAAGSAFSSTNDIAKLGKAILTSELISPATTRRWLKPTSFLEDFAQAVGRPWEIFRVQTAHHSIDMYTKAGDWGVYSTFIALVPEYDFGFTVFTTSAEAVGQARDALPSLLADEMLPVLAQIAREQNMKKFADRYAATGYGANSSITIISDDLPALRLTEWIHNGTDMFQQIFSLAGGPDVDYRLVPNQLPQTSPNLQSFTSVYQKPLAAAPEGDFYSQCQTWFDVDQLGYGNVPLGQFTFEMDPTTGKATSVHSMAMRTTLVRQP